MQPGGGATVVAPHLFFFDQRGEASNLRSAEQRESPSVQSMRAEGLLPTSWTCGADVHGAVLPGSLNQSQRCPHPSFSLAPIFGCDCWSDGPGRPRGAYLKTTAWQEEKDHKEIMNENGQREFKQLSLNLEMWPKGTALTCTELDRQDQSSREISNLFLPI